MIIKNNRIYDILKWLVITVMPAACTLITGLGLLYGFDTALITGTISLVTTFIGTIVGISAVQYANSLKEESETTEETVEDENADDGI